MYLIECLQILRNEICRFCWAFVALKIHNFVHEDGVKFDMLPPGVIHVTILKKEQKNIKKYQIKHHVIICQFKY